MVLFVTPFKFKLIYREHGGSTDSHLNYFNVIDNNGESMQV